MLLAVISSEDMVVFNNTCYWFVKKGGGDQDNLGYEAATKGGRLIIIQDLYKKRTTIEAKVFWNKRNKGKNSIWFFFWIRIHKYLLYVVTYT